jgi:FkbM family methyltransferase
VKLDQFVNQGDWVIDIGANIGHYTGRLSELVGPEGRVIAFEPVPISFWHLSLNCRLFSYQNITLINAAASGHVALLNMSIPRFSSGLDNYYEAHVSETKVPHNISVLGLPIDNLDLSGKVSLIKIDAEGHEPSVFSGMWNLIERDRPFVITERVDEDSRKRLNDMGYTEEVYDGSPNIVFHASNQAGPPD